MSTKCWSMLEEASAQPAPRPAACSLTRVQDELNEGPANLELCEGARAWLCAAAVASDASCSLFLLLLPAAVTALSPQQRAANCSRRYEKPCDATKKKVKLFTIKPLFLHVSLSGAPPMFARFCFNRLAPSSARTAPSAAA
jgi:hypothetical protein